MTLDDMVSVPRALVESLVVSALEDGRIETAAMLRSCLPWEPPADAVEALCTGSGRWTSWGEEILTGLHVQGWHLVRDEPTPDRCQDGAR